MKMRMCIQVCTVLCIVLSARLAADQEEDDPERARILEEVKTILRGGDTFEAIEFVNSQGEPEIVADRYFDLVMDFYWKERALSELIVFAKAGIQYSLTKAQELGEEDSEKAVKLRSIGKAMAYNLASFTWPGWNEEGIILSEGDLATGLDAAKLNLRLAHELSKPASAVSAAHWVLGAQYLAGGSCDEAIEAFALAREKAREADDAASEWMNLGYIGIARITEGSEKTEGEKEFREAIEGLQRIDTKDAQFYMEQLESVLEVFSK